MTSDEEWRPVVGYEGYYEVSSFGRVQSLDRRVPRSDGRTRLARGRVLSASRATAYPSVSLHANGHGRTVFVHALVAEAFIGPRPEGLQVCHGNGDHFDNRAANLRYDTQGGNMLDAVRHGTHYEASKTHCDNGHEYAPENIYWHPSSGERCCRTCRRIRSRRYTAEQQARRQGATA